MDKQIKSTSWVSAVLLSLITAGTHGELINRGNGLVADTVLDITWMRDASLFETLCEANDPIATEFVPVYEENAKILCYQDGRMSWFDANAWMDRLNEVNYKGYSDWRLPIDDLEPYPTACGTDCTNIEMSHLVYVTLGNLFDSVEPCDTFYTPLEGETPYCIKNRGPFYNIQSLYWTGTYHPLRGDYMFIKVLWGEQSSDNPENRFSVWPVRDGLSEVEPSSNTGRQWDFLIPDDPDLSGTTQFEEGDMTFIEPTVGDYNSEDCLLVAREQGELSLGNVLPKPSRQGTLIFCSKQ